VTSSRGFAFGARLISPWMGEISSTIAQTSALPATRSINSSIARASWMVAPVTTIRSTRSASSADQLFAHSSRSWGSAS
jgi:hypothetical protein